MKKAFTLIELLAVIIIIAVIALIATPVMTNVIENAREEARKDSVIGYADSVRLSYAEESLINTGKPLKELASEKMQGDEVVCEYVKYDTKEYGTLLHSCKVEEKGDYCYFSGVVYNNGSEECKNVYSMIVGDKIPYKTPNIYVSNQTPEGTEYAQSKEIVINYPSLEIVEEHYYVKLSDVENIEINVIGKCSNDTTPGTCTMENVDKIEANTWYEVSGNTTFKISKNIIIEAITGKENIYGTIAKHEENNIDNSEPSASIESISTTSNKAVVIASCEDLESGIIKYEFSKDGSTWLTSETNSYTFDIEQNINYKFKVRCTNGSGISKEVESESEVSANKIIKPTIEQISQTPENSEYVQSRTIKITYDGTGIENPKYSYSYDGKNWIEVNSTTYEKVFTENKEIYAKTEDESGNESEYAWYKITNIDTSTPESPTITANDGKTSGEWHTSNTTLTFTGSSSNSGITYYYGTSINSMTNKGSSVTINNNTKSTTYYVKACSGSGICSGNSSYEVKIDGTTPSAPTLTATDGKTSGTWHTQDFTITASGANNISENTYYYKVNEKVTKENGTIGSSYVVNNETKSYTYYVMVCSGAGICSDNSSYEVKLDKTAPAIPTVTYNGGSNSHSWKNNYNIKFSATDNIATVKFQIDHNQDGVVDREYVASSNSYTFIPENGYSTCTDRYRAVDEAGNASGWTAVHHIHMDTISPTHTNWWWGEITKDVARLYIQATDNIGISKVQCPTSTQTGGYTNWHWFDAVWDSNANAYRCDITPSTFGHYGQTYQIHLYIYDHANNGGYYNQTSALIPTPFTSQDFGYTGGVQAFTVPMTGTYKLEVWGAQGNTNTIANPNEYTTYMRSPGGKGGYSYGNVTLTQGQTIYIVVGGQNGYNGGGINNTTDATGGGATHIAKTTNRGVLSAYATSTQEILIVAGGGGGGGLSRDTTDTQVCLGGTGGGTVGGDGYAEGIQSPYGWGEVETGGGATQSTGGYSECTDYGAGTFGQGGSCDTGGGGGYYGGGAGGDEYDEDDDLEYISGAGGGSGYIGGVTGGSMQNGIREGHGYARITLVN